MPDTLSPMGDFARAHDPDRFLCALFAPADRREALFVLIAFNHELARARELNPKIIELLRSALPPEILHTGHRAVGFEQDADSADHEDRGQHGAGGGAYGLHGSGYTRPARLTPAACVGTGRNAAQ